MLNSIDNIITPRITPASLASEPRPYPSRRTSRVTRPSTVQPDLEGQQESKSRPYAAFWKIAIGVTMVLLLSGFITFLVLYVRKVNDSKVDADGKSQATRTILVDMDATIADYVGHFVASYNILFKTDIMNGDKPFLAVDSGPNAMTDYYFYSGHKGHFRCYEENPFAKHDINDDKYTPCSLTDPDFYQVVLAPDYFKNIPPMEGAVEALRELQATPGISVKIVTFPEPNAWDRTIQDKRTWLTTHLGPEWATDDVARFVDGVDKCTVRGDILIDDREKPSKGNEVFCQTTTCSANGQNLPRPKEGWAAEACQAYGVEHQVETIFTNFNEPTSWRHVLYSAPYNLDTPQTYKISTDYTVARLNSWRRNEWITVLGGTIPELQALRS